MTVFIFFVFTFGVPTGKCVILFSFILHRFSFLTVLILPKFSNLVGLGGIPCDGDHCLWSDLLLRRS